MVDHLLLLHTVSYDHTAKRRFMTRPRVSKIISLAVLFAAGLVAAESPVVGPSTGTLVLAGGGRLGAEIIDRFLELAGGPDAHIVVIPTAGDRTEYESSWRGLNLFRNRGAPRLTVLHTRDRTVADDPAFVAPLRQAHGVWFPGGRQWRLVDAYLDTRVHRELEALLARGGVVGGTSAGATILGSYLVRGAREGNHIVMAPGYEEGFGLLRGAAVDQHLLVRRRQNDLVQVIRLYPELLGIGIDEGTAVVVQGDRLEVIGRSRVAVYAHELTDGAGEQPYVFLRPGDTANLRTFKPLSAGALQEAPLAQH